MSLVPKFSVIVPMYKVEEFLPECVESIRCQTLHDIEIILVDDGSPDRCGEIADAYAQQDKRIRVVHRENGGLGPARNSGLEVATGEYVGFVDSDDWIECDMYERLYEAAKNANADVVFTGLKTIRHGKTDAVIEHPYAGRTLYGSGEIFELRRSFYGAAPARVKDDPVPVSVDVGGYRRDFIKTNDLRFMAVRSEDKFFNTAACRVAQIVTCIGGTPYCYRKDDQPSITKTFSHGTIESFFKLFHNLEQLVDEEPEVYQKECRIREQRCVIDYSRVLIGMIEDSAECNAVKNNYLYEIMWQPALIQACENYPWWRLPLQQAIFLLVLKSKSIKMARLLTRLKRG